MPSKSTPKELVSIIVRTQGKRQNLLRAALGSIIAQSYARLEVLVVEDGSSLVKELVNEANEKTSKDLRYFAIERSGRCAAGNIGLACANGAFIGFLDEDDELYPTHVETLHDALTQNESIGLAYGGADKVLSNGLVDDQVEDIESTSHAAFMAFSRTKLWLQNQFPIQRALFRRALYDEYGGFDPNLELLEDWDLWIRFSASQSFLAVDKVTSLYRLPASLADLKLRTAMHESFKSKVIQKHRDLEGLHRFGDISALPDETIGAIPFRRALSLAGSAFLTKIKKLGREND